MKIVNQKAIERALAYYDIESEKLLKVRADEFVKQQPVLTVYLVAQAENLEVDEGEVLLNAAFVQKAFLESGFHVPKLTEKFIDHWDERFVSNFKDADFMQEPPELDDLAENLPGMMYQQALSEYFLNVYYRAATNEEEMKELFSDEELAQLHLLSVTIVDIFHRAVNNGLFLKI
ncbi:MAG TPA: hypothetical protein VE978_25030 [Chitinophagales bacterium]|nr:hypothetical protein [Chitinophagales bacterium]